MKITPAIKKYIHHWGEIGIRWGTNRSVAQIQALLISHPNLTNEDISKLLNISKSTVNTNLRELQNYGLVMMKHIEKDREDYFESIHDVWELFRVIIEKERKNLVQR